MKTYFRRTIARVATFLVIFLSSIQAQAQPLEEAVRVASEGLGAVVKVNKGHIGQVVLLEEEHVSRAGQIEIAHMLTRLHRNNNLRTIGLEGFTLQKLEPRWANALKPNDRLRLAARLLSDGELSSAEFMALAFSDIQVLGIDSPTDYKIVPSDEASASAIIHLMIIGASSMKKADSDTLNDLLRQNKLREAKDFAVNKDPWTRQMYAAMYGPRSAVSTEATLSQIDEIEKEAKKRNVKIPEEEVQNLQSEKQFLQAASRRSDYMVSRIAEFAAQSSDSPVAAIVGAAHTDRMLVLLKDRGITVVVVRPNALSRQTNGLNDAKEYQAYQRKLEGRSVDVDGLGGLLERKNPPIILQPWLEKKAAVYQLTFSVVDSVLVRGDTPPYDFRDLPSGYTVDPKKITRLGEEILFPIDHDTGKGKQTVWVRAAYSLNMVKSNKEQQNIEDRISKLLQDASGGGRGSDDGKPPRHTGEGAERSGKPEESQKGKKESGEKQLADNVRQLREGIYARFGKTKSALEKESILTASKN